MSRRSSITSVAVVATSASLLVIDVSAFTSPASSSRPSTALPMSFVLDSSPIRPIYDPLGLYPESAPERIGNRISPIEGSNANDGTADRPVLDPLKLYADSTQIDADADMSVSLPFLSRPRALSGELAGDVGFDPLGLASSHDRLMFMREAEIKHGRIAMLAAAGWPLAELLNTKLAFLFHVKPLLGFGDRVPSVLNGGLDKVSPVYWASVLALAGGLEVEYELRKRQQANAEADDNDESPPRLAGDFGFDPLNLYNNRDNSGKDAMQLSEIKHGRLAMVAITVFALQEFATSAGVVPQLLSVLNQHSTDFLVDQGFSSNLEAILSRGF